MLRAMREIRDELPDLIWLVIGEGPDRRRLERAISDANLDDRVRLLGLRPDALQIIGAADAVVQPSLHEAYSQVMAEALWMRRPLVMTTVSGATDLITSGETGLLVPKANASALADALRVMYHDAALREHLGKNGRYRVEQHLSLGVIMPRFENTYTEVVCQ
jgi:glycosyltransferase involved in cell wall biosynthesis